MQMNNKNTLIQSIKGEARKIAKQTEKVQWEGGGRRKEGRKGRGEVGLGMQRGVGRGVSSIFFSDD